MIQQAGKKKGRKGKVPNGRLFRFIMVVKFLLFVAKQIIYLTFFDQG
jgi:hypothetical protein